MQIQTKPISKFSESDSIDLLVIPTVAGKIANRNFIKTKFGAKEISHHLKTGDLNHNSGSSLLFYPQLANFPVRRVLILELGKNLKNVNYSDLFKKVQVILKKAPTLGVVLPDSEEKIFSKELIYFLNTLSQSASPYKSHSNTENNKVLTEKLFLFSQKNLNSEIKEALALSDSASLLKRLGLEPANKLTPNKFAELAKDAAKKGGFKVEVYGENELQSLGFGGTLAVGQGSDEESKLVVMEYNPKAKKSIGLVGKGITFDSGGISIKPSKDMHEMKYDMIGGALILALMQLASELKLPWHIIGAVPVAENLPSGKAIKPGDVIEIFGGKTVEVVNTDAEGRLVLADALAYLENKYKPNYIFDFATLTGLIVAALGDKITGGFGNNEALNSKVLKAAKRAKEELYFLPLYQPYNEELKSPVADLANVGKKRFDPIIGGLFLQNFIGKTPWIHFDIGGTAWDNEGPTAVMLKTVLEFLK